MINQKREKSIWCSYCSRYNCYLVIRLAPILLPYYQGIKPVEVIGGYWLCTWFPCGLFARSKAVERYLVGFREFYLRFLSLLVVFFASPAISTRWIPSTESQLTLATGKTSHRVTSPSTIFFTFFLTKKLQTLFLWLVLGWLFPFLSLPTLSYAHPVEICNVFNSYWIGSGTLFWLVSVGFFSSFFFLSVGCCCCCSWARFTDSSCS